MDWVRRSLVSGDAFHAASVGMASAVVVDEKAGPAAAAVLST